ncbi:MAG: hypothetical protein O9302_01805 [Cyclobacteriaceae bacterium]|jgi:hypothetical protein|nr:hypothetical protein [Cytophagales bacterium]MCZ8326767.1 hypothetical protein [Cyclobacteriaceae bacterium]
MIEFNKENNTLLVTCSEHLALAELNQYTILLKQTLPSFSGNSIRITLTAYTKIDFSFFQFVVFLKAYAKQVKKDFFCELHLNESDQALLTQSKLLHQIQSI